MSRYHDFLDGILVACIVLIVLLPEIYLVYLITEWVWIDVLCEFLIVLTGILGILWFFGSLIYNLFKGGA